MATPHSNNDKKIFSFLIKESAKSHLTLSFDQEFSY